MIDSLPVHGGQLHELSRRFGISASELVDFSANINPDGPPAGVLAALRAGIEDLSTLTTYPDLHQRELRQCIAHYADIDVQNVVAGNGFVPLLEAALRALSIRRCLLPVPAFVEYRSALMRARIEIAPYLLRSESDFNYDIDAMFSGEMDAILLANPQNPSGVLCKREEILRLVEKAAERNVLFLLDEAFIDYLPGHSVVSFVDRFANLIVFRSVTKFHGIPGLRVAYAAACPRIAGLIDENMPPWPVTTLAASAVCAALADSPYASRTRALNEKRRARLQREIEALGIYVYPSAANFLLLRLPGTIDAIAFWRRMIADHHIVMRSCANYESLPDGHVRAAVRSEEDNAHLVEALRLSLR
jgi:threonine-phosphate decarboxylase